jgi:uridine phosphorylase
MEEVQRELRNLNPNLADLDVDFLYHLGLSTGDDLKGLFGDVKHVAMMGSGMRAWDFARKLHEQTGMPITRFPQSPKDRDSGEKSGQFADLAQAQAALARVVSPNEEGDSEVREDERRTADELRNFIYRAKDLPTAIAKAERFEMYKVGDTIAISHGMGEPSHSINLHEVTKLLQYAGAQGYQYYRLGTSGGLGVEGGTVVVADRGHNPTGEPTYKIHVLGKQIELPAEFDPTLAQEIFDCRDQIEAVIGGTMASEDFYTVQARLDGAFCMITAEEKMEYLRSLHAKGIRNIEMEAAGFGAFCKHMGIPAACICVALLNRLNGDQVTSTKEQLDAFSDNPQQMLIRYIQRRAIVKVGQKS